MSGMAAADERYESSGDKCGVSSVPNSECPWCSVGECGWMVLSVASGSLVMSGNSEIVSVVSSGLGWLGWTAVGWIMKVTVADSSSLISAVCPLRVGYSGSV